MAHLSQRFLPSFRARRAQAPRLPTYFASEKTILVATKMDESGPALVSAACRLASRLSAQVSVLHVCPRQSLNWHSSDDVRLSDALASEIGQECFEASVTGAVRAMARWSSASHGVPVRHDATVGMPSEEILKEAIALDASLIVLGARLPSFQALQRPILSTSPLNLVTHSPYPVLVIPERTPAEAFSGHMAVLLADDLTAHTLPALAAAWDLTRGLGDAELWHAHLTKRVGKNPPFRFMPARGVKPFTAMTPAPGGRTTLTIASKLRERLMQRMAVARGEGAPVADTNYASRVIPDDTPEALDEFMAHARPDLVVLGRHATWLRHPVEGLRQVARILAAGDVPLLVIPPQVGVRAH